MSACPHCKGTGDASVMTYQQALEYAAKNPTADLYCVKPGATERRSCWRDGRRMQLETWDRDQNCAVLAPQDGAYGVL